MKINNIYKYHDLFKSYINIIIIQLLISFIRCQVCDSSCISGHSCDSAKEGCNCVNPKYHFEDRQCYDCSVGVKFYIILDGQCIDKTIDGCLYKIISDTGECVGNCPDKYCQLEDGDFCYLIESLDINSKMELNTETPFEKCKCKKRFKKETIENKLKYSCIDNCGPTSFYNYDTGECLNSCDNIQTKDTDEIRCSSICKPGEFFYNNTCQINKITI